MCPGKTRATEIWLRAGQPALVAWESRAEGDDCRRQPAGWAQSINSAKGIVAGGNEPGFP
ncbi:hypothetical protein DBB_46240 [Desulfoluna spongiiphila]|nr:hypothetical protein DBB_46240 [Desulfoluna spongiiphila]